MKNYLTLILVLGGLQAACRSPEPTVPVREQPAAQVEAAPVDPGTDQGTSATLYVKGMSCPLCANNIDKQLMKVPGVKHVSVDLGSGAVQAKFGPGKPPSERQLAQAIERSGFTLDRIDMPTP